MQLLITQTFKFAHGGTQVEEYPEGATVEAADPELISVALAEGWAVEPGAAPRTKARKGAPENK